MRYENSMLLFSRRSALMLAAVVAFSASAWAQDARFRRVTKIYVKPERAADFTAALKDFKAGLQKANWDKTSTWWRAASGKGEFVFVRHFNTYAEMDAPGPQTTNPALAAIFARSQSCVETTESLVEEINPDLSLPRSADPPTYLRVLRTRVQPSKVQEYLALLKSDLMPAVRKSEMKAYSVAQIRYGAPGPTFESASGLNGWADLDGEAPLVKAMGQEAYQRYLTKRNALILSTEATMYRYLPELSYLPKASGGGAGKTGN